MSGCAVVSEMDPLRAAGPIPQGFVAPQSKVSTFSFVAPRPVKDFLAALPVRVFQQAPNRVAFSMPSLRKQQLSLAHSLLVTK